MTTTINASTTAGLVQTADTSGVLALQTAGTTAVTVDASQNVGVGVTPSTWTGTKALEVGSLGTALWSSGAGSTTLSNGAYYNSGWKYANATSKPSILDFDNTGKITYYAATATSTAGSAISLTQLLAVEAGKSLALQGATVQTGAGITFPATQSASSDANTLDDYEEGTFTPTWTFAGSSVGITYSLQNGSYVKIGRLVYLTIRIALTAKGSSTGSVRFANLPFTAATPAGQEMQMGTVWYNNFTNASNYAINCRFDAAVAYIELRSYSGGNELSVDQGWINNNSTVSLSICYET